VLGDYPEWLDPYPQKGVRDEREEGRRWPPARLDFAQHLKGLRKTCCRSWPTQAEAGALCRIGLRIALTADARARDDAEPAYMKGLVEIQTRARQLAAVAAASPASRCSISVRAAARRWRWRRRWTTGPALTPRRRQAQACADPDRSPPGARTSRSAFEVDRSEITDLVGRLDLVLIDAAAPPSALAAQSRRQMAGAPAALRVSGQQSNWRAG